MKDYAVLRLYIRNGAEAHSIEYKDTLREAETRFHNILASDEGNNATDYCLCMVYDKLTNRVRSEIHDYREEKTAFYVMVRIYEDAEGENPMHNSVQIYADDPEHPGEAFDEAENRWYAVYAADINNAEIVYNAAIMMDNNGAMGDYHKAKTKAVAPTPEPEPEQEGEE